MAHKSSILSAFEHHLGPAQNWAGQCFAIASRAVEKSLVPLGSVAVYGHWTGPVHPSCMFNESSGGEFVQHGWVLRPDGRVCDPTRWVFEHVDPYIFIGAADHYDEGGNKLRMRLLGPPPEYDESEKQFELTSDILPKSAWIFVEQLLQLASSPVAPGIVSSRQLHWLGNQDPASLGRHAAAIYDALDALHLGGIVPWDNRQMVKRLRVALGIQ